MATSKKSVAIAKSSGKLALILVWLDDSAADDPNAKTMFLSLYEEVYLFMDPTSCLELIKSIQSEIPCISILVSGKYGQMLAREHFQPLQQVKDIYVFCYDVAKHNQWAQHCDKVRCVDSDFNKILKFMQRDVQKTIKQYTQPMVDQPEPAAAAVVDEEEVEIVVEEPPRFSDDNNLYDQLAIDIVTEREIEVDDGLDDFKKYCEEYKEEGENQFKTIQPDLPIKDWYKPNLVFLKLNSTDIYQFWALRWFLRIFHQQLHFEYKSLIRKEKNLTVYYGTWLTTDEFNTLKHRLGQSIIFTELLLAYDNAKKALESIENKQDEKRTHRVVLEINVDTLIDSTVPYARIRDNEILFWLGSRYQLIKIELIQSKDNTEESYWIIGLNLSSTMAKNQSVQTLYKYYSNKLEDSKDFYCAFGRILMYKGLYYQAEQFLQSTNHFQELAELALRQNQIERANQYLEKTPEDSDDANLLRAYVNLLTSTENVPKGRTILMKICSEATDKLVRARANIALGFINLIVAQQFDQAFDYFHLGNETLSKNLPDIHPDIAKSMIGIGYAYFAQQKKNEAEEIFQKALQIQQQFLPPNHPDLAKTHNGLAHCFSIEKRTHKKALNELEQALNILLRTFPQESKSHPEILLTKMDIEKIRKQKDLRIRNTLLDYI